MPRWSLYIVIVLLLAGATALVLETRHLAERLGEAELVASARLSSNPGPADARAGFPRVEPEPAMHPTSLLWWRTQRSPHTVAEEPLLQCRCGGEQGSPPARGGGRGGSP